MNDLKVTLVQTSLVWENRDANLDALDRLCGKVRAGGTDLIVLPEMFSTGFSMEAEKLSETMRGPSIQWMKDLAARKKAAVCGSVIFHHRGRYYNRLVWMRPDGSHSAYDKRHLFSMAGEQHVYTAGQKRMTVTLKGWKVCPLVCYDLRFPVWSRQTGRQSCDLMVFVANWPSRRRYAWNQLLIARAIENQCYVAAVNRVGKDGNGVTHSGDSLLLDPMGQHLCKDRPGRQFVRTVNISYKQLMQVRRRLPFLHDADRFKIL